MLLYPLWCVQLIRAAPVVPFKSQKLLVNGIVGDTKNSNHSKQVHVLTLHQQIESHLMFVRREQVGRRCKWHDSCGSLYCWQSALLSVSTCLDTYNL